MTQDKTLFRSFSATDSFRRLLMLLHVTHAWFACRGPTDARQHVGGGGSGRGDGVYSGIIGGRPLVNPLPVPMPVESPEGGQGYDRQTLGSGVFLKLPCMN